MGMSRPSYGRGQGSFFGRRPPPMRNPRMPMPPMNQPQAPSGGGFMSQLVSSPMMRRPMPGGPGKGRSRGRPMPGGPGKGRSQPQMPMPSMMGGFFDPVFQKMPQGPMPLPPTNQPQAPSGGFFLGNMLNNAMSQGQIGQPQPPFMGRVLNNMPRPKMTTSIPNQPPMGRPSQVLNRLPQPNFNLGPMNRRGFYSGGITDLY